MKTTTKKIEIEGIAMAVTGRRAYRAVTRLGATVKAEGLPAFNRLSAGINATLVESDLARVARQEIKLASEKAGIQSEINAMLALSKGNK